MRACLTLVVSLSFLSVVGCEGTVGVEETSQTESANTAGDRRDPANAKSDRVGGTSSVWGRKITLHLSDPDNAAWASIDNGDPGDEAWLDRSFEGGKRWDGKVGKTKIPNGQHGWRTLMYDVDDLGAMRVGAMRACGKAGNRPEVTCTSWLRTTVNAGNRLDAAATALMQLYDGGNGKWRDIGWWNTANAMTALLDYEKQTGSRTYSYAIANTFDKNKGHDFTNEYMDDTGWWGLAWVRAYDLTRDSRYLDMARRDAEYMWRFKDDKCGGGVWWRDDKTYKNAITNELFVKLAASLHNRMPGDTSWRDRGLDVWRWFKNSGMINGEHLVNDGLDGNCKNNNGTTWTYNQGVLLGALVELADATNDSSLVQEAKVLANASTASSSLNPGGTLREPCESSADACGVDGPSFKGIYVRNLGELDQKLADHPYRAYLDRQADTAYAKDRTSLDQYGVHWNGPIDTIDAARQHSALDLLTAAAK
jgi:predicted alpha-1,6-mannanase (GH76 family)